MEYICDFFEYINTKDIDYFLYRDVEFDGTKDIDIYVDAKQKQEFLMCLNLLGWKQRLEPSNQLNHNFYLKVINNTLVTLDVNYTKIIGTLKSSVNYVGNFEGVVIKGKNNISKLRSDYNFIFYVAHLLWEKNEISSFHKDNAIKMFNEYKDDYSLVSEDMLCINDILLLNILGSKYELAREHLLSCFCFEINTSNLKRKKRLKPTTFNVLFLGADGVGKSTLIEKVSDQIFAKHSFLYLGQKKWAIPFLEKWYSYRGRWVNILFKYFIYPLDIYLRLLINRKNSRYINYIDRFPGPSFTSGFLTKKIYQFVLPDVDKIILLTGDCHVVAKRKNEISPEKYILEERKWEFLAESLNVAVIRLDTTQLTIEQSVEIICKFIIDDDDFLKFYTKDIEYETF